MLVRAGSHFAYSSHPPKKPRLSRSSFLPSHHSEHSRVRRIEKMLAARAVSRALRAAAPASRAFSAAASFPAPITTLTEEEQSIKEAGEPCQRTGFQLLMRGGATKIHAARVENDDAREGPLSLTPRRCSCC
jgi:hypothetical protein